MNSHDELKVLLIEDDEDDYVLIKTLLSEAVPEESSWTGQTLTKAV